MLIGVSTIPTERSIDPAVLARRAEQLGFESIWTPEQNVLPVETETEVPRLWGDIVDPFIMLARVSATTSRIKLGTAVTVVTERDPVVLAKQVATLDMYSAGRVVLGIGVGWSREAAEFLGSDFPRRWTQARETVSAMKELWTQERSEFHGRYYDFPQVYSFPSPARRPHPPVVLGGRAPAVLPRVVQWGDGWIPINVTPEDIRSARATLNELSKAAGRDPASIEISVVDVPVDREVIDRFAEAGADRVIVPVETAGERDSLAQLERIAETVLR